MLVLLQMFALFLLVALGFYIFVADPRKRAHQTFGAFVAFLAIWTIKDLVFWNFYPTDQASRRWAAASFIIALLMQFAMVHFAWVFPENRRTPRRQAAILFAPAVILIPVALVGLLWHRTGFSNGQFEIELSTVGYVFVGYVYLIFVYGAVVLFKKYKKNRGTLAGNQIGAIIWGLAITGFLKTLANIVLPYFGYYDLLPLSSIFFLPGVLIYAYAVLNFKLFSLQTALNQFRLFPITYKVAISIAAVAISSFALLQIPITWWAFHNGMDEEAWRRYLVFSVISALVPNLILVLLILRTISRPLQRIALAAIEVTKGGYGKEVDLRKTNDELGLLAESFNTMSRKMAADIDELQRLNSHLVRTEKLAAMGTIAAGVAHEVNNPLASVSSLIQMMRKRNDLPAEVAEHLEHVAGQIKRIADVTKDMMNFARAPQTVHCPIELNSIIETALRVAGFDPAFQKFEIIRRLSRDIGPITADAGQMEQVVLNILLNARDAMPDGGVLTIKTEQISDEAVISIADTGSGIDADTAKYLFDPFYSTKPPGEGTGLGLAVCYGIVTVYDGRIEVEQNLPYGAIFKVFLPTTGKNDNNNAD